MPCMGNQDDHCCYLRGRRCPFSIDNYTDEEGNFRRWACSLRAEYGNWDDVIASDRYQKEVHPYFPEGMNCRDWPESHPNWTCPCFDKES